MTPILFDLDGTLLDSAPDIHAAVNRLMDEMGLPRLSLDTVISFIGNGIGALTQSVVVHQGLDPADAPALTPRLLAHYDADPIALTRPYPGVAAALHHLAARGHALGVCTNKPEAPARKVLAAFGLNADLAAIVGGDTCATRKPDPAPLLHAMSLMQVERCLYVGDSEVDAATAKAAGMPFVLFTQGYCHVPHATLTQAARFDDWSTLPDLIATLAP